MHICSSKLPPHFIMIYICFNLSAKEKPVASTTLIIYLQSLFTLKSYWKILFACQLNCSWVRPSTTNLDQMKLFNSPKIICQFFEESLQNYCEFSLYFLDISWVLLLIFLRHLFEKWSKLYHQIKSFECFW